MFAIYESLAARKFNPLGCREAGYSVVSCRKRMPAGLSNVLRRVFVAHSRLLKEDRLWQVGSPANVNPFLVFFGLLYS